MCVCVCVCVSLAGGGGADGTDADQLERAAKVHVILKSAKAIGRIPQSPKAQGETKRGGGAGCARVLVMQRWREYTCIQCIDQRKIQHKYEYRQEDTQLTNWSEIQFHTNTCSSDWKALCIAERSRHIRIPV